METIIIPKVIILAGLAIWLGIAMINNIVDSSTNVKNLEATLTMSLLIEDPTAEQGLAQRAWTKNTAVIILYCIAVIQAIVATMLLVASISFILAMAGSVSCLVATDIANIALSAFTAIWFFFLCGGLWFGYWIKQGQIQSVHFSLLLISIAALIFVNETAIANIMPPQTIAVKK
ncbi:MAG: DUF2165 domain-containing protein [Brucellaceae bacterium]|jgi:predicted small integral membrane protein|nr:DUF2165 domain-containing protein [Brucellaceae bacterium]